MSDGRTANAQEGVALFGATGYSGREAARLLHGHPRFRLAAAFGSGGREGVPLSSIHPSLRGLIDLPCRGLDAGGAPGSEAAGDGGTKGWRTRSWPPPRRRRSGLPRLSCAPASASSISAARSGCGLLPPIRSGTASSTRPPISWKRRPTASANGSARRSAAPPWSPTPAATRPRRFWRSCRCAAAIVWTPRRRSSSTPCRAPRGRGGGCARTCCSARSRDRSAPTACRATVIWRRSRRPPVFWPARRCCSCRIWRRSSGGCCARSRRASARARPRPMWRRRSVTFTPRPPASASSARGRCRPPATCAAATSAPSAGRPTRRTGASSCAPPSTT